MEDSTTYNPQIHCDKCGYTGTPKAIKKPDPFNSDSFYFDMACPNCNSDKHITIKENSNNCINFLNKYCHLELSGIDISPTCPKNPKDCVYYESKVSYNG